jgi:hypothetical protein
LIRAYEFGRAETKINDGGRTMPLLDHFHGSLADRHSWEELHGAWPGVIAFRLNGLLSNDFRSGVRVRTALPRPPEYEITVYDEKHARRLVAAVEIVSPGNKDRPDSREAFVSKCHALLQQGVCVAIVDPVTERSANLYAELADRLGAAPPWTADRSIYAVACRGRSVRGRWRVESWEHELIVGTALPTLPLWLTEELFVPLELEATYEDTCRGLRIA